MDPQSDPEPNKKDSSLGNKAEKPKSGNDPAQKADPSIGQSWIENLAQRSTGLPEPSRDGPEKEPERSPWSYASLGLQTAGTIALFTLMGYAIDAKMQWTPWATVSLAGVGIIGSCYLLIKEVIGQDKPKSKNDKK